MKGIVFRRTAAQRSKQTISNLRCEASDAVRGDEALLLDLSGSEHLFVSPAICAVKTAEESILFIGFYPCIEALRRA